MTTAAATIKIAIEAQTAELKKGFAQARQDVSRLEQGMSKSVAGGMAMFTAGLAAVKAGLAAAAGALRQLSDQMTALDAQAKLAVKVGMTADQLVALQHAAGLSGESVQSLSVAFVQMNNRISEATQGSGEAMKALDDLGLSAQRMNALPTDQRLGAIADALKNVPNQADKTRIAMDLFGRSGVNMLRILEGGSAGLDKFGADAARLGLALGDQRGMVEAANDAIHRMKQAWGGMVAQIAVAVAPALEAIANAITRILAAWNHLMGRSQETIGSFQGGLDAAKKRADDTSAELLAAQKKAEAEAQKLAEDTRRRAEQITTSLRTPGEQFADQMRELNALVAAGEISWETYRRGMLKAREDLMGTAGSLAATPAIGAATRAGGAFSALQQAGRERQDAERRHRQIADYLAKIYARMKDTAIQVEPVTL